MGFCEEQKKSEIRLKSELSHPRYYQGFFTNSWREILKVPAAFHVLS